MNRNTNTRNFCRIFIWRNYFFSNRSLGDRITWDNNSCCWFLFLRYFYITKNRFDNSRFFLNCIYVFGWIIFFLNPKAARVGLRQVQPKVVYFDFVGNLNHIHYLFQWLCTRMGQGISPTVANSVL